MVSLLLTKVPVFKQPPQMKKTVLYFGLIVSSITMSSGNFLGVFFALLGLVYGENLLTNSSGAFSDGVRGNCTCGGFPTPTPSPDQLPCLSQSPGLVVVCNEEGETTCKSLCLALATATKAKGPEILCNRLGTANELKLSAFYKACDKPWTFADMTADEPLCCENSKVKVCTLAEATTTVQPAVL